MSIMVYLVIWSSALLHHNNIHLIKTKRKEREARELFMQLSYSVMKSEVQ